MSSKSGIALLSLIVAFYSCKTKAEQEKNNTVQDAFTEISEQRYVEGTRIISKEYPNIEIEVNDEFTYVGKFDFEIIASSDEYPEDIRGKALAAGERLVFAVTDEHQNVEKLFIAQFEGFLDNNDFTYNYNFDNAAFIGNNKYRQNTWFYNSKKLAQESPRNEGALTRAFLEKKGYVLEDEFMMSRYVGLASEDRKKEVIFFYLEMLKSVTGYSLNEYQNTLSKEKTTEIERALVERSKQSFSIVKG